MDFVDSVTIVTAEINPENQGESRLTFSQWGIKPNRCPM
jgi:hypothetical protein